MIKEGESVEAFIVAVESQVVAIPGENPVDPGGAGQAGRGYDHAHQSPLRDRGVIDADGYVAFDREHDGAAGERPPISLLDQIDTPYLIGESDLGSFEQLERGSGGRSFTGAGGVVLPDVLMGAGTLGGHKERPCGKRDLTDHGGLLDEG